MNYPAIWAGGAMPMVERLPITRINLARPAVYSVLIHTAAESDIAEPLTRDRDLTAKNEWPW